MGDMYTTHDLVNSFQRRLTESIDAGAWNVAEIDCTTYTVGYVRGAAEPLI